MISRRALLGTGIGAVAVGGAVVAGQLTHKLDDVADAIGLKPRPQPVSTDDTLIASVAQAQNLVLSAIEATAAQHPELKGELGPFAKIAQEHVTAVGGSSTVPASKPVEADPAVAVNALSRTFTNASSARAKDAARAVSPDLARVLSSMSAGLAQSARAVGALA